MPSASLAPTRPSVLAARGLPVATEVAARAAESRLSTAERSRYSRHILLPEVGAAGQQTLLAARVLVVGLGGLGSPVAMYLAAAGVGTLGLVDFDQVDSTNLQRQILYREADVGGAKITAAAAALTALNAGVKLELHAQGITLANAAALVAGYDVIVDGTDNFATRYLVHDAAVLAGKPYVYGSIQRFAGQAAVFYPPHGPCYRCLFPAPPGPGQIPNCAEAGVLGVLPAQIGAVQATETLKLLLGIGSPLLGRLLTLDALAMTWSELRLPRDESCPLCSSRATITRLEPNVTPSCKVPSMASHKVNVPMSDDDQDGAPPAAREVSVDTLHQLRQSGAKHTVLDVRGLDEVAVCRIEGSLVIPLQELPQRLREVPRDQPLVVHCKSGGRSARAVELLQAHGFTQARSLVGGILAWIDAYDSTLARY